MNRSRTRSSSPPVPARGKSILIQVYRRSHQYNNNAWFMINETATGPKISEVFHGLLQDDKQTEQFPVHKGTNCVFVGSHLYDIGGRGTTPDTFTEISNQIRRLNTKNLEAGWKSETLPFYCADAATTVYGNFIYIFPYGFPFRSTTPNEVPPWAYMYDTIEHKAYEIQLPDDGYNSEPSFCIPLENHGGVVVPIEINKRGDMELYVHETYRNKWKPYLDQKSDVPNIHNMPHVVSDGNFYVYKKNGDLDVYEISNWKFRGTIELPEIDYLDIMDGDYVFMVAVADSEICFLWVGGIDDEGNILLRYAKVSVYVKNLEATLLEEAEFRFNACDVVNCLSCDSVLDEEEELKKNEVMILRERCIYLEEKLRRKEEELQRIKEEPQRLHKKSKGHRDI